MWTTVIIALTLSTCSLANPLEFVELLRSVSPATTAGAAPGSASESYAPTVTQVPPAALNENNIELRQVPTIQSVETLPITGIASVDLETTADTGIPLLASVTPTVPAAPVNSVAPAATVALSTNAPAEIPINPTTVAPAVPPITPPAPPAALTLIAAASPPEAGPAQDASIFVTIQWLETWIGGTSRTWLPHTITLYQGAPVRTAPLPGKGQIGMGTLTGELGITRTVVQGGANTAGPEWKMGAVAAAGMGIVGII